MPTEPVWVCEDWRDNSSLQKKTSEKADELFKSVYAEAVSLNNKPCRENFGNWREMVKNLWSVDKLE